MTFDIWIGKWTASDVIFRFVSLFLVILSFATIFIIYSTECGYRILDFNNN